jgi:hypothetical protein
LDRGSIVIELLDSIDRDVLHDLVGDDKVVTVCASCETRALEAVARTILTLAITRVTKHVLNVLRASIHTLTAFDVNEKLR